MSTVSKAVHKKMSNSKKAIVDILNDVMEEIEQFEEVESRLEEAEQTIEELENNTIEQLLPQEHRNIRMVAALQAIMDNISYIDVAELEALANKTPMLPAAY